MYIFLLKSIIRGLGNAKPVTQERGPYRLWGHATVVTQERGPYRLWGHATPGHAGAWTLRAPESAHQQWGGSPHRTEHWLSVVEGNCVVERRGGRQPETNC